MSKLPEPNQLHEELKELIFKIHWLDVDDIHISHIGKMDEVKQHLVKAQKELETAKDILDKYGN